MAHRLIPNHSSNRALVRAVRRGDPEGVRAALAGGADANIYLMTWHQPLVALATNRLALLPMEDAGRPNLEAIVLALMEAGADLTWTPPKQPGVARPAAALHFSSVRAHPDLGRAGVAQLRQALAQGRLSQDQAVDVFKAATGDTPVDEAVRDAVFDALDQRQPYPPDWVELALGSNSQVLMQYCQRRGLELGLDQLCGTLQRAGVQGPPLSWWLEQMAPPVRLRALLGAFGNYGLLALTERYHPSTREAAWAQALACPGLARAMAARDQLPAYLVLAVRQDTWVATALLDQARELGVKVGKVRGAAALDTFSDIFDPKAWRMRQYYPPREGSLLACHLHYHEDGASASVCRKLARMGVVPQPDDLVPLARAAVRAGMKSPLARLLREWIAAGLDPEPAGEPSVWEQLGPACAESDIAPFRAWGRNRRLTQALGDSAGPPARAGKPRL